VHYHSPVNLTGAVQNLTKERDDEKLSL